MLKTEKESLVESWQPWVPTEKQPWDARRVAHLHRRAGFAGTWKEIQRDIAAGHAATVERFLNGKAYETAVPEDFESLAELIGDAAATSGNPNRLQAWWLYRMIFSPDPLTERLCLMWHHHFATSNSKVGDIGAMYRQNQLFRKYGRGDFGELFAQVIRDPAMLVYLDANSNRVGHPNENLGREMLELFSVGRGNFGESDVRNVSKALTGWTVKNDQFEFVKKNHDNSEKVILEKTGKWNGDDAMRIALEHPGTAKRITFRVCQMLMGEGVVSDDQLTNLAKEFGKQNMNVDWLLKTVLSSKLFYSPENIGSRVQGATEFVVGSIRALGAMVPPPSTLVVSDWTTQLGQRLFYPPNVFGFAEGRQWISSQWLISRNKFMQQLVEGKVHQKKFESVAALKSCLESDADATDVEVLGTLLLAVGAKDTLAAIKKTAGDDVKKLVTMILTLPLAHLG